jgi:hypothetical protein
LYVWTMLTLDFQRNVNVMRIVHPSNSGPSWHVIPSTSQRSTQRRSRNPSASSNLSSPTAHITFGQTHSRPHETSTRISPRFSLHLRLHHSLGTPRISPLKATTSRHPLPTPSTPCQASVLTVQFHYPPSIVVSTQLAGAIRFGSVVCEGARMGINTVGYGKEKATPPGRGGGDERDAEGRRTSSKTTPNSHGPALSAKGTSRRANPEVRSAVPNRWRSISRR